MKKESASVRLWRHVDKSGDCWTWKGSGTRQGYGLIWSRSDGQRTHALVHRLSWELANGPIPEGLLVLHRCDNPPCVNPDHLFLGTHADNAADKASKRRAADTSGERNPKAKLTTETVADIRRRYRPGKPGRPAKGSKQVTASALAEEYGVSPSAIYHAARGWSWHD